MVKNTNDGRGELVNNDVHVLYRGYSHVDSWWLSRDDLACTLHRTWLKSSNRIFHQTTHIPRQSSKTKTQNYLHAQWRELYYSKLKSVERKRPVNTHRANKKLWWFRIWVIDKIFGYTGVEETLIDELRELKQVSWLI